MSKSRFIFGSAACLALAASTSVASAQNAEPPAAKVHTPRVEAGVFGGLLLLSDDHSIYRHDHEPFSSPIPELGARLAVLPLAYVGIEGEALAGPARTENTDAPAGLWAARGHLLLQLPGQGLTPFVLAGAGAIGTGSNPTGTDSDAALHLGIGAKFAFDDFVAARLDLRDVISAKYSPDESDSVHSPEVLLGLSFNLDFKSKPAAAPPSAPVPDRDADGTTDAVDACPDAAGPAPRGCPAPRDTDNDGFVDDKDACPAERGIGPVGCPDRDPDRDCVETPRDQCPDEPGLQPDGCPDRDPDRDGVLAPNDKCPREPETKNGFEDADGCPDALPEKVKKFSGVIPGIEFDLGKATIRAASNAILNEAASVLEQYPALRVAIAGHTDDVGDRKRNIELSEQRAGAVKSYLVARGISAERIETRGAGPDEPVADNKQAAGRQKNRRIEFKLLPQ